MAECSVYVIGQPNGLKKIGIAKNVYNRRNYIQCAAPFEVLILTTEATQSERHAFALEQMCHADLTPYWVFGEWFNCPLAEIRAALDINAAKLSEMQFDIDAISPSRDGLWVEISSTTGIAAKKDIIRERTRAGLAAAKARGRVGGRASLCTDAEILATKRMGTAAAAKRLGYKTPAAYLRRLAVAEKNAADAAEREKTDADLG